MFESGLKGLAAWKRVVDNRVHEILQKNNIEIYKESKLTSAHINELEIKNILIATGSKWRKMGLAEVEDPQLMALKVLKFLHQKRLFRKSKTSKTQ